MFIALSIQNTILGRIITRKYEEIAHQQLRYSRYDLEQIAAHQPPARAFATALNQKSPAIIAEIKKASPSKGIIRTDFDVASIAKDYERAGAACLSVLTDVDFFQGHSENVAIVHNACQLPILRKDFMVNDYHIVESRALQADCVLLIVAVLSDQQLQELSELAFSLGMHVLVEVHDANELDRALTLSSRCLLGVNNRNLKTFDVDLNTTVALKQQLGSDRPLITESGISTSQEVQMMQHNGIDRFLVGESFMRHAQPGQALQALFGQPRVRA